eukprot:GCRY01002576.1.p1 GENE.GCRY01002576.1~~GCRY01002576.1.p1  ORF type:complete len:493 (+),score=60.39 GCRY01002576.1:52-1479(+)
MAEESKQTYQNSYLLYLVSPPPDSSSTNVCDAFVPFGSVIAHKFLPHGILIQLHSEEQARKAINAGSVEILGQKVEVQLAKQTEILNPDELDCGEQLIEASYPEHNGEKIILISIHNARYPMTVDVLEMICRGFGQIVKIVVFHKNGKVKAFVEFETPESARDAQRRLEGNDVYDGCNRLRVEYSKLDHLNVTVNDQYSRDFTNSSLRTTRPDNSLPADVGNSKATVSLGADMVSSLNHLMGLLTGISGYSASSSSQLVEATSSVLLVHNLPPLVNTPERICNLMCIYGNVVSVKLLQNKTDSALVQFESLDDAQRALAYLNKCPTVISSDLTPGFLNIRSSNHSTIDPLSTPDSSRFSTFGSEFFRFNRERASAPRIIQPPSSTVYFANLPAELMNEEQLNSLLTEYDCPAPTKLHLFNVERADKPPHSGLVQYASVIEAVQAVAVYNNTPVGNKRLLRLAFAQKRIDEEPGRS